MKNNLNENGKNSIVNIEQTQTTPPEMGGQVFTRPFM